MNTIESLMESLSSRDAQALLERVEPGVSVWVTSGKGLPEAIDEHLWQDVSLSGQDDLQGYLAELFECLPALNFVALKLRHGAGRWRATVSGVNREGVPFKATAEFKIKMAGELITDLEARVLDLERGPDLLKGTDPRAFFEYFIRAGGKLSTGRPVARAA